MKSLVLCACVLILAFQLSSSSELKKQLKNAVGSSIENDAEACLTENDMTKSDFYKEEQIVANLHAEPENAERTRKNGCWVVCILKKQNLMEGTNINEAQVHAKINEMVRDGPGLGIAHKIARKCLKRARGITQECEKGFSLFECVANAIHKLEQHEEHEIEAETEEEAETGQAE